MTVHDSFATHADDVETLLDALKSRFVFLHEQPLMERFREELQRRYNVTLPPIEYVDDGFDLQAVERSEYFFA
jgi:DNA-directed RNA polymerase